MLEDLTLKGLFSITGFSVSPFRTMVWHVFGFVSWAPMSTSECKLGQKLYPVCF